MADKTAENPRKAIREAREKRLRVIDGPPKTIKVFAGSESIRATMRHSSGVRFRSFVAEQGVSRALFVFFDREVMEQDLKPG